MIFFVVPFKPLLKLLRYKNTLNIHKNPQSKSEKLTTIFNSILIDIYQCKLQYKKSIILAAKEREQTIIARFVILTDASSSNEAVHLQQRLKSLSTELVTLRNKLHVGPASNPSNVMDNNNVSIGKNFRFQSN